MTQSACKSTPEVSGLRIETLPFERIPHQSRLFLDYLHDPLALRRFYPSVVNFHHQLVGRRDQVLGAHKSNREELCDALEAMNRRWGAGAETLVNIISFANRRRSLPSPDSKSLYLPARSTQSTKP